jgi:Tol biopolymer transport system component
MTFSCSANAVKNIDNLDISIINKNGGRVDWSHSGNNLIAFDRMTSDGYFDVWTMKPDGGEQRCLTCDTTRLPQKHIGNPVWHPSGKFIVFQAQKRGVPKKFDPKCTPGAGALNDLWVMTSNGKNFWKIYQVSPEISKDSQGVLHPQFSHNGENIIWSERVKANKRPFGEWVIKIANFVVINNAPKLTQIKTIRPSQTSSFYETHSFSPDDRYFLFTGNQDGGLEIYEYDLLAKESRRLTQAPKVWDEHAHYTLTGKKIIWMSSKGLTMKINPFQLKTEFWVMDRNGKNKRQLTYFNYPGKPHYMNQKFIVSADSSWSPDGKKLIILIIYGESNSRQRDKGMNVMMDF